MDAKACRPGLRHASKALRARPATAYVRSSWPGAAFPCPFLVSHPYREGVKVEGEWLAHHPASNHLQRAPCARGWRSCVSKPDGDRPEGDSAAAVPPRQAPHTLPTNRQTRLATNRPRHLPSQPVCPTHPPTHPTRRPPSHPQPTHRDWDDEEGDLDGGAQRHADGQVHLVLHRHKHGCRWGRRECVFWGVQHASACTLNVRILHPVFPAMSTTAGARRPRGSLAAVEGAVDLVP